MLNEIVILLHTKINIFIILVNHQINYILLNKKDGNGILSKTVMTTPPRHIISHSIRLVVTELFSASEMCSTTLCVIEKRTDLNQGNFFEITSSNAR